jgi:hypothetical protein
MEALEDSELQLQSLRRELHLAQDLLEIERERRRAVERELAASQIRCADALDAMASVMASVEYRAGRRGRAYLARLKGQTKPTD